VLTLYFESLLLVAVVLGLFSLGQFFCSDTLALQSMGACEVDEDEYPDLHRTGRANTPGSDPGRLRP
jgi:heat shock protein HtpX